MLLSNASAVPRQPLSSVSRNLSDQGQTSLPDLLAICFLILDHGGSFALSFKRRFGYEFLAETADFRQSSPKNDLSEINRKMGFPDAHPTHQVVQGFRCFTTVYRGSG